MDCEKKLNCRLCDSTRLENVVKLTSTPPGNHFVSREKCGVPQVCYPLELDFCLQCGHVQLAHVVDPKILYQQNYSYVSATSSVFVKHLETYAAIIIERYGITPGSLVLDIGSNDGTALSFFKKSGCRVLGIDPAIEISEIARRSGIETVCDFFNLSVAEHYSLIYGKAKLITSHNACAHIDDLQSVIAGVNHWLDDDGIFVMEIGYFLDVYENVLFDTIYHEHVDFHTVGPLIPFFERFGMEVIHVERISPQGGSIRVIVQKNMGKYAVDDSVAALANLELQKGLRTADTLKEFNIKIDYVRNALSDLIIRLKNKGFTIAAYGAPTKATTLLAHFNLNYVIDYLVEDNSLKQGLFSPGAHLPVYAAQVIYEEKPDYLILLAWNFSESIMKKHEAYLRQGGQFILPMPVPKTINFEEYNNTMACL